jgi:hypothetical protein
LSEDADEGYQISVNLREGTMSINQNLILLADEPEIFLSGTGRIIFQFKCLTANKIYNQKFDFLFEETEHEFKISNTFDTVCFSNQVVDLLTFPLIVTYSIKIKKPQNT